jgi:hypothetical protein
MGTQVNLTDGSVAEKVITVGLDGQVPAAEASGSTAGNQTAVQAPVAPATATATKSELAGTISHTTSASRTDGQQSALEADLKGNVKTSMYEVDSTTPISFAPPSTGTKSNVNDGASSVTILAANAARKGATFWNDSTAVLYLDLSGGTATATSCSVKLGADEFYELPDNGKRGVYTGLITGIWASDQSGAVRVTEFT